MPDNRLPTNQSQLDIVEKLDEIKDAIAQSGGGTGGHTIIDENGNSMTARAGLQFVGANVDDDATNNKTIVDVASAGGIDGVFVDLDNVIQAQQTLTAGTEYTYTATEDCIINYVIDSTSSANGYTKLNDIWFSAISRGTLMRNFVYVKKGQIFKIKSEGTNGYYTVYGIQTGTTHSKFQPVIYSTEEREIGVWKDGRPLYQKTVDFGALPNDTTKTVSYNISDLDYFVKIQCVAHNQNGSRNIPFVDDAYKSGDVLLDIIKSSGVIRIIAHTDLSSLTGDVTLQYVKTTDVAGSGSWTPQGVPTHHYSTDEQVIGTWIDGNTLYEKTFYIHDRQFNSNGECDFDVTSLNSDILMADNMASYYTFSISSTEYTRQFEKLVPEEGHVYAYGPANRQIVTGYITIKYTKSS